MTRKKSPSRRARTRAKAARPTPEALLERVAAKDTEAFLDLYARLAPALLGVASQVAGDRQDATADVEEAFVRLWRTAPRFPRETASVAVWLTLDGRRAAMRILHQKKGASHHADAPPDLLPGSYAWLPKPDDVRRLEAKRELLRKALRQLPKRQQDALSWAVWEGLSEEAIAQRIGEPLAKVQSSLRAGMRFIRHRMRVVLGTWSANI